MVGNYLPPKDICPRFEEDNTQSVEKMRIGETKRGVVIANRVRGGADGLCDLRALSIPYQEIVRVFDNEITLAKRTGQS